MVTQDKRPNRMMQPSKEGHPTRIHGIVCAILLLIKAANNAMRYEALSVQETLAGWHCDQLGTATMALLEAVRSL